MALLISLFNLKPLKTLSSVAEDIRQMQDQINQYGSLTQFGVRIQTISGPGGQSGGAGYINNKTGGSVQGGEYIASWEIGNWGDTMTIVPNPG